MNRSDRFTFMPGDLKEVTDQAEIADAQKRAGFIPPSEEEQAWISNEGCKRWSVGDYVSTDELRSEYARRKALGTL
jgi:hypothetical protein